MADLNGITVRRRHVELGEVLLGRTVAIVRAGGDTYGREKQAHDNAHLSH